MVTYRDLVPCYAVGEAGVDEKLLEIRLIVVALSVWVVEQRHPAGDVAEDE